MFILLQKKKNFKGNRMKFLILTLVAVSALSTFPVRATGFTTEISESEIEEPKTLPLTAAQDQKAMKNVNEIWQEDEREVLIRNERGAKDNGASGATTTTGKKGKKDHNKDKAAIENNTKNTQQQKPLTNHNNNNNNNSKHDQKTENTLNNSNSTSTTHTQEHKKNQHHQKHDNKQNKKNTNIKKHEKINEDDKSKMIPY